MGVPRGQERQAPQEVPEPRLSQLPVPRALPRRGRCSSGPAAAASPGSPGCSLPWVPALGAAPRAGRGEACEAGGSAVRVTFGASSAWPCPLWQPGSAGGAEGSGVPSIGGGKGAQVVPADWSPVTASPA